MSSRRPARYLITLAVCVALLTPSAPAEAGGPRISLSPKSQHPQAGVTVGGRGFGTNETVDIVLGSTLAATAQTDGTGAFSAKLWIPASTTPGGHKVKAIGESSGLRALATLLVRTDWQGFHFDLRTNRYNPYENVLNTSSVSGLTERWSFTEGDDTSSSPAVANGVVYFGSSNSNVYALDASTGAKLWSFTTGGAVYSSPAVANAVVYVGSSDSNVYALDALTGAKLWSFPTGGSVTSSPAVAKGMVYVGSYDNNVYALDAGTGAKVWSFTAASAVLSSPAVANGMVYVGSYHDVYALDAGTGEKLWSFTAGGFVSSSPAVASGMVYVASDEGYPESGHIYALDASTGGLLWTGWGGLTVASPAAAYGIVYSGDYHTLFALNAFTGEVLWTFSQPYGDAYGSPPAVANGVVYAGIDFYSFYALDAFSGEELWRWDSGWYMSPAAIANGMVFVGSGDIHAFGV